MVTVTPKAVSKIREQFVKHGVQGGLRLGVLGGGCSGLSYLFKFDVKPRPTDTVYEFEDVKVFVDPKSMVFLNGMTLDWKDSLIHSGFEFDNPNAKKKLRLRNVFLGVTDYYALFDIPRALNLSLDELQKRYYALSRELHPDRFMQKSEAERQRALDMSSALNDAYRTLKDPVKRAQYLLTLEGFDIGEQRSKDVPPELLEEVFELNMALEEMRGGDDSARPQLEQAEKNFVGMLAASDQELAALFANYDAGQSRGVLGEIRNVLNRRKYIQNLVSEVEKTLIPT